MVQVEQLIYDFETFKAVLVELLFLLFVTLVLVTVAILGTVSTQTDFVEYMWRLRILAAYVLLCFVVPFIVDMDDV